MNEGKVRKLLALFQDSDIEELEVQSSFWHGTRIRLTRSRAPLTSGTHRAHAHRASAHRAH